MSNIWFRAHLTLVNEHYPKSRTRQRLPDTLMSTGRPQFQILEGGLRSPWRSLKVEQRTVQALLKFNSQNGLYTLTLSKDGELLEQRMGKKSQKLELSLWIEKSEGKKVRIPWAKVAAGEVWEADVELHDFYFQRLEDLRGRARLKTLNAIKLGEELDSHP